MINPRISLGNRALGGLGGTLIIIISIFIGMKFGIKGVDIFLLALLGTIVLFITYWVIKFITLFLKNK